MTDAAVLVSPAGPVQLVGPEKSVRLLPGHAPLVRRPIIPLPSFLSLGINRDPVVVHIWIISMARARGSAVAPKQPTKI